MDADLECVEGATHDCHEWNVRRERFYNDGYRDALDQGKTATVQEGFNAGFQEGAAMGVEWGALRGALTSLLAFPQSLEAAQLQKVKDLWERVATHEAGAASLACAAAAEDHGFPSSLGPEAAEEGEEQSISDIAPLNRLQLQAIERWQQVLVDARHMLANMGLAYNSLTEKMQGADRDGIGG